MMLAEYAPNWLASLIMVGALAAFMSTMDSQLLALSSMLTRDVVVDLFGKQLSLDQEVRLGKLFVVILAVLGLVIALQPPATLVEIVTEAFTGLAVLFPTTVAVLYSKNVSGRACIWSICVGEALVLGFHLGWLPEDLTLGFLPVVPIVLIASLTLWAVSKMTRREAVSGA